MKWMGRTARMGDRRGAYKVLEGKPEGKRPLGRPRHRWEDNIKMGLKFVGNTWTGFFWFRIATSAGEGGGLRNAVMNVRAA